MRLTGFLFRSDLQNILLQDLQPETVINVIVFILIILESPVSQPAPLSSATNVVIDKDPFKLTAEMLAMDPPESVTAVIDSESTDFNGFICQLAVLLCIITNVVVSTYVNPAPHVPPRIGNGAWNPRSVAIHKITPRMVANSPGIIDVIISLLNYVSLGGRVKNITFIAHNAPFDRRMLTAAARIAGVDISHIRWVDSLRLVKPVTLASDIRGNAIIVSRSLAALIKHYLPNTSLAGAHNASFDVLALYQILRTIYGDWRKLHEAIEKAAAPQDGCNCVTGCSSHCGCSRTGCGDSCNCLDCHNPVKQHENPRTKEVIDTSSAHLSELTLQELRFLFHVRKLPLPKPSRRDVLVAALRTLSPLSSFSEALSASTLQLESESTQIDDQHEEDQPEEELERTGYYHQYGAIYGVEDEDNDEDLLEEYL